MARRLPSLLGVVGAGQMGAGIAQVAATCGLQVGRDVLRSVAAGTLAGPFCQHIQTHAGGCPCLSGSPGQARQLLATPTQVVLVDRAAAQLDRALYGMEVRAGPGVCCIAAAAKQLGWLPSVC